MVFGRPSFVMFPPALSVGVGKAPREETVGVCGQGNLSRLIGGPMTACDAVDCQKLGHFAMQKFQPEFAVLDRQ